MRTDVGSMRRRGFARAGMVGAVALATGAGLTGCSNGVEGAISGAGIGAVAGLIAGSVLGGAGTGAAVGAAIGGATGAVIGDQNERNNRPQTVVYREAPSRDTVYYPEYGPPRGGVYYEYERYEERRPVVRRHTTYTYEYRTRTRCR